MESKVPSSDVSEDSYSVLIYIKKKKKNERKKDLNKIKFNCQNKKKPQL